jgi:hypothetical protein
MNTKHFNHALDGSDIPENVGDRYYGQDRLRDFYNQREYSTLIARDMTNQEQNIVISGLEVSQGTGHTIDITAGRAIVDFQVKTPDSWGSLPPTMTDKTLPMVVELPELLDQAIAGAITDGTTVNYIKIAYNEVTGSNRDRAKKTGNYNSEVTPSYTLTVNSTAPTAFELSIAKFTSNGSTITFQIRSNIIYSPPSLNVFINGKQDIWQRGTSFVAAPNGIYLSDRRMFGIAGATAIYDITQQTDVPNAKYNYSLQANCTTAQASLVASEQVHISEKVEGYNFKDLVGEKTTIAFWVKSNVTGIYSIFLRNSGLDRTYVGEYVVNKVNNWERKHINVNFDYVGGTWNYKNGVGIEVGHVLVSGPNVDLSPGSWQNTNRVGSINQVNHASAINNYIRFTDFEFYKGNYKEKSPLIYDIEKDQDRCERYYEKSYQIDTTPGSVSYFSANEQVLSRTYSPTSFMFSVNFGKRKRGLGNTTVYSNATGAVNSIRNNTLGSDQSVQIAVEGETGFIIQNNSGSFNDQDGITFHWVNDNEL